MPYVQGRASPAKSFGMDKILQITNKYQLGVDMVLLLCHGKGKCTMDILGANLLQINSFWLALSP